MGGKSTVREKTFGQKLRDIFAAIGLCESTEDIARRPSVIKAIMSNSAGYGRFDVPVSPMPYEQRLYAALDQASVSTLDRIARDKVVVCLDQRQSRAELGFWDYEVLSAFYNGGGQKIISLYDNGKAPNENGFFERGVTDWSGTALDTIVGEHFDGGSQGMMLGTTHLRYNVATKTTQTYFRWHGEEDFESELRKNPALRQPPRRAHVADWARPAL